MTPFAALAIVLAAQAAERRPLEPGPAPLENPLKGLVPYAGEGRDGFPHSLEFDYLPLSALVTGPDVPDWTRLDRLLDGIAGRGRQAVLRIFLEYPGRKDGIPEPWVKAGLGVTAWKGPDGESRTPDYASPILRNGLKSFIAAFGKRYDGDARLGFLTAGLLGSWGEWHTYPREELFARKEVQAEVMDAYEAAFRTTPVLLRYPAGEGHGTYAPNQLRGFGYHDDSFAWATLETGRKDDDWFFLALLRRAGPAAQERWKRSPIGGEIRPEAWGRVFDENPGRKEIQSFRDCVDRTHVTWLMDSGMFGKQVPEARRRRAEEEVRRMGYVPRVAAVTLAPAAGSVGVKVEVENFGVAPFYHDWPAELAWKAAPGRGARLDGTLKGLLPGAPARVWEAKIGTQGLAPGEHVLLLRVPNPLPTGRPVRFANRAQDADLPGWLTLGALKIGP
jgi:hypothetical protein